MDDDNDPADPDSNESRIQERKAFITIADLVEPLSDDARLRLFRLLITHFDIPLSVIGVRPASTSPSPTASSSSGAAFTEDRTMSPKQFLLDKRPQTDIERVACLAYYLAHYRGQTHFKTVDLSKLNTEAAQTKLANPSKTSDNAVARNLLVQVGGGKRQISAVGELYVQALPDRIAAKAAVAHARPRRRPVSSRKGSDGNPPSDNE